MLRKIELCVRSEDGDVVYEGDYEGYLEMNDYDSALLECISRLSSKKEDEVYYTNDLGECYLLVNSEDYEEE